MTTATMKRVRSGTLILLACVLSCEPIRSQVAPHAIAGHAQETVPKPAAFQRAVSAPQEPGGPPALFSSTEPVGQTVHLVVGRSLYINTPTRLRRVYVSNPDVLNSFTASPNQIVVTAKGPGVSSLILWNDTGQSGPTWCLRIWMLRRCAHR